MPADASDRRRNAGAATDHAAAHLPAGTPAALHTHPTSYGTGKLAYTGVATEPLIAWGAALLASGASLILSGRRRA